MNAYLKTMSNATAYLLIGGNLGNRMQNLQTAHHLIQKQCGKIVASSSVYETAAWGLTDQPDFLNQVLSINTNLSPQQLITALLSIEKAMGRKRLIKFGPRIIDLDILLIDDLRINEPNLTVPHPALPQRKFALIPLAEIAAGFIHPIEKKSIQQLLTDCTDELNVKKYSAIT
jgi:2-amino-4-hydroxy-6-hydroxymethyldihydropteridine diphosphokinase